MITEPVARTTDVVSFGPFTLVASERLLMKEGGPVELGSRTLDILIALVSRPNEIVGKRELLAQVWPDVTVEEGSLRFHIAGMLGLSVQSDDPIPGLIAYLRDKKIVLILDNCEHIIEAAASLAERIFLAAPQVHILATSREALRVQGERVHRLAPLGFPPDDAGLTAAIALTFPAVELFLERAEASGIRLDLNDSDAAIVASICRRLDGVPLAIELAAGRVEAYGLQETATLLEQRLTLPWLGQRTAPPRQRTLQATLDWSYGLLSAVERVVLRRLAVFVGHFTLEAARAVVTSATIDQVLILGAIGSLVAKSMVSTNRAGTTMRYRLLDTTRAYALEINVDDADLAEFAARHATYYRGWLEQNRTEWPTLSSGTERAPHLDGVNNVRAALEWCFGVNGDREIGIGLAAAAVPIFLVLSLLPECHRWSERAILALDDTARGGSEEMHLQAGIGISSMQMQGEGDAARLALNRSLAIAEERNSPVRRPNRGINAVAGLRLPDDKGWTDGGRSLGPAAKQVLQSRHRRPKPSW